jgi:hypothetical protein
MAAFTFHGTSPKIFRSDFGPQQGLAVSPRAMSACVFVLRRARVGNVVLVAFSSLW